MNEPGFLVAFGVKDTGSPPSRTGDLIVKVVNAQAAARTAIDLGGANVASKARATTLAAAPDAVNIETSRLSCP
ncbi:MAG: hypothetical protein HOY79_07120 [Streptomyces sp.]|nr:hypothetical protein [Streptomyces sp.]